MSNYICQVIFSDISLILVITYFKMAKDKKLKIGWFSFTCCEDSSIMFTEMLNDNFFKFKKLLDFRHAKIFKSKNELSDIDVAFVEGAIAANKDKEKLKKIREASKYVVAIGSCAVTAMPSGARNKFDDETKEEISAYLKQFDQTEKIYALNELIKVDDAVPGCPMVESKFLEVLEKYLKKFEIIKESDSIK
jgi:coenzyme F420-reducing hydrogenase gamma subunit